MFAAFQKASWNWVPIPIRSGSTESEVESQLGVSQTEDDKMIHNSESELSTKANGEFVEIPLSSDDEDRISPRGILQFRKFSEGELSERSKDGDDSNSIACSTEAKANNSRLRAENDGIQTKSGFPESICHVTDEVEEGKDCGDANASPWLQLPMSFVNCRRDKVSIPKHKVFEDWSMDLATQESGGSLPSVEKLSQKDALIEQRSSNNAGTQTPSPRDDFASTKIALQRQLADALSALDLTRNQANALRDRLRTYTSSMRQQTTDLRASTKSLTHALDKAKEYRTNWKREEKLKDEANKRADELEVKTKSLEKTVAQYKADLNSFNREVDVLNNLLGVENAHQSVEDKLNMASNEVKVLLNLVKKVQAEAALASAVNTVELKESLRRFEDEKASWIAFAAKNEEVFAEKIKYLETKNEGLKNQIESLQRSSDEIRELLQQKRIESDIKGEALKGNDITIRDLETALCQARDELKASACSLQSDTKEREKLREAFHIENTRLVEEKRQLATSLTALQRDLEEKRLRCREQSVHCDLDAEYGIARSESESSLPDGLRSSTYSSESQLRRNETERKALHREVEELKRIMDDMKNEIYEKEQEYFRLRGDFRHLNWTSHHQQVTIQRVRAENRSLRISLSKLRRGRELLDGYALVDNSVDPKNIDVQSDDFSKDLNGSPRQWQSSNESTSESERKRLQTIHESSDEGPMSSPGLSPASSRVHIPQEGTEHVAAVQVDFIPMETNSMKVNSTEACTSDVPSLIEQSILERTPSNRSDISLGNIDMKSTPKRKRSRKTKRKGKSWLPIWRQENPNNQFATTPKRHEIRVVSSSDSEDVFMPSIVSLNESKSPTSDQESLADLSAVSDPPSRLVGIPMDEGEFERLIGSMDSNDLTPIARPPSYERPMPPGVADTSLNDDGYSSSAAGACEANDEVHGYERLLHSTRSRLYSNSSKNSSVTTASVVERFPEEAQHCFLTYGDVTFDAMTFDLTQMRNIAWEAGIAESENGMNNFIEFLAAKSEELEEDPQWQGKHSLGKSSEWLSLKGLLY